MADALSSSVQNLPTENPPATGSGKGGRKNRNNNKGDEGGNNLAEDAKPTQPGLEQGPVPTVGDADEGGESLKIRIRLNLQAKVKLELDADIRGEIVIGLL